MVDTSKPLPLDFFEIHQLQKLLYDIFFLSEQGRLHDEGGRHRLAHYIFGKIHLHLCYEAYDHVERVMREDVGGGLYLLFQSASTGSAAYKAMILTDGSVYPTDDTSFVISDPVDWDAIKDHAKRHFIALLAPHATENERFPALEYCMTLPDDEFFRFMQAFRMARLASPEAPTTFEQRRHVRDCLMALAEACSYVLASRHVLDAGIDRDLEFAESHRLDARKRRGIAGNEVTAQGEESLRLLEQLLVDDGNMVMGKEEADALAHDLITHVTTLRDKGLLHQVRTHTLDAGANNPQSIRVDFLQIAMFDRLASLLDSLAGQGSQAPALDTLDAFAREIRSLASSLDPEASYHSARYADELEAHSPLLANLYRIAEKLTAFRTLEKNGYAQLTDPNAPSSGDLTASMKTASAEHGGDDAYYISFAGKMAGEWEGIRTARAFHDRSYGHAGNITYRMYELDALWRLLEEIAPKIQTLRAQLYVSALSGQQRMNSDLANEVTAFFDPSGSFSLILDFMIDNQLPLTGKRQGETTRRP